MFGREIIWVRLEDGLCDLGVLLSIKFVSLVLLLVAYLIFYLLLLVHQVRIIHQLLVE